MIQIYQDLQTIVEVKVDFKFLSHCEKKSMDQY